MHDLEIYVCIDNDGDWSTGGDAEAACNAYESEHRPLSEAEGHRVVKIKTRVALPTPIEIEAAADPAEA